MHVFKSVHIYQIKDHQNECVKQDTRQIASNRYKTIATLFPTLLQCLFISLNFNNFVLYDKNRDVGERESFFFFFFCVRNKGSNYPLISHRKRNTETNIKQSPPYGTAPSIEC